MQALRYKLWLWWKLKTSRKFRFYHERKMRAISMGQYELASHLAEKAK